MITITEAANYLRIDNPDQTQQDEIRDMLEAAKAMLERKTGYVWEETVKDYYKSPDGKFYVYDFPINTDLSALPDGNSIVSLKYCTVIGNPNDDDSIQLSVGYRSGGMPKPIEQAALQLLKHYYYESETGAATMNLPPAVRQIVNTYRRFVL